MSSVSAATPDVSPLSSWTIGTTATLALGALLLGFALSVNFPTVAVGFQNDESTYYMLGHSLARDFDFAYERKDLARVWEEFPSGPEGVFLKRGKLVGLDVSRTFPYVRWRTSPELRTDKLYYGKAYIYPLVAAPFVRVFGTNGFLVLHALLLTLAFCAAYAFLAARSGAWPAVVYAPAFFGGSAAPVYFVWITPELFNLALTCYAFFLWSYKEVARSEDGRSTRLARMLRSPLSDYMAAALVGVLTFSRPTHLVMMLPIMTLPALRRQWRHDVAIGLVFACVTGALFVGNVAITGEFNYQGGDRRTFYGATGFAFLTPASTFEAVGIGHQTDRVLVDIVFTQDAFAYVLRHNLLYFLIGRHTGLVPYFFPGVLSALLFLGAPRQRQMWQWLVLGALAVAALALLLWLPFTYSGGGGPLGNRYFLAFYPMFLFLTPPLGSALPALAALAVGGLFTARLVFNPFYTSFYLAEHAKTGPFRWLPVELSLVNDLPVNITPSRARQPLSGDPPMTAYFLDSNAYGREGEWFWVKGESRAELILRGAVRERSDGAIASLEIAQLQVEVRSGDVPNRVTLESERSRQVVEMGAHEMRVVTLEMPSGFPYRALPEQPTSYVYTVAVESETGFTPMFTEGSRDNRYLGAFVHLVPVYRVR